MMALHDFRLKFLNVHFESLFLLLFKVNNDRLWLN